MSLFPLSLQTAGLSPLHYSVRSGRHDVTRCLIEAGADLNAKTNQQFWWEVKRKLTFFFSHNFVFFIFFRATSVSSGTTLSSYLFCLLFTHVHFFVDFFFKKIYFPPFYGVALWDDLFARKGPNFDLSPASVSIRIWYNIKKLLCAASQVPPPPCGLAGPRGGRRRPRRGGREDGGRRLRGEDAGGGGRGRGAPRAGSALGRQGGVGGMKSKMYKGKVFDCVQIELDGCQ